MSVVLARLRRNALAESTEGEWKLTEKGRSEAGGLVRAHRLWETYLAGRSSIPSSHLHEAAERLEHVTDPTMAEALGKEVEHAERDPHGRLIPPA